MILKNCIEKLMHKQNLDFISCQNVFREILSEQTNPLQIAAFLVLLRAKPETVEEIASLVTTLRRKMITVPTSHKVLDIVGTGGDAANTINISTGSAILAASCGIKIAKHGNRAVSSLAGAADVLEALGINIDLSPKKISMCIDQLGIGFCFSPNFHPAMHSLRNLRKQLNVPTTLNILGPLLNPAKASHIVMGVFDEALLPILAHVLRTIGGQHSVIAHGCGLDEISTIGPAKIFEVTPQKIIESTIDPEDLGFERCTIIELRGGTAKDNAKLLLDTFNGKPSAIADTLILNAAVALWLYGSSASILDAIPLASENLYSGKALALLNNWKEFSHD